MYYTYLDGEQLYHPHIDELTIENTKLSVELNKTGSFRFDVREGNPMYAQIKKMKSIVKVYDGNDRLFRGRVLNAMRGFYNELQVTCEGELAFLLDSKLRPYSFRGSPEEYFTYLITEHNKQVDEDRQFKIGVCTVTDPNDYITRSDSTYPDTLTTIQKKLLEPLGGYLWTREKDGEVYIDYLADFNTTNSQVIEFGENLLNFVETIKGQDIVTAIIPLGARLKDEEGNDTDERLDIKSVNGGIDYVYSAEAVEKYGWIYKVVTWDDVTLPQNLLAKAEEELQKNLNPTRSMELSAIDLHDIHSDIQRFRIGRYTRVKSEPHDLDDLLLTRKLDIDLMNPANGLLALGVESQTFVEKQVNNQKTVGLITEQVKDVEKKYELNKEKLDQAISDTIITSDTEPEDKSRIWCDTSVYPNLFKRWNEDMNQWSVVNDTTDVINAVVQNIYSVIEQESDYILSKVNEEHYLKENVDSLIQSMETLIEQTSSSVKIEIKEVSQDLAKTSFEYSTEDFQVSKVGADTTTHISEDGMRIKNSAGVDIHTVNSHGTEAENLYARKYLTVGEKSKSRFEDYEEDGELMTGVFFTGN